jgi:hypothetical protein
MKSLGKVAGGIGIVLLVSAPFTWYLLRNSSTTSDITSLRRTLFGVIVVLALPLLVLAIKGRTYGVLPLLLFAGWFAAKLLIRPEVEYGGTDVQGLMRAVEAGASSSYGAIYAYFKLALGLLLIAFWVLRGRDPGDEKAFVYYVSSALIALLVIALGAGVNFIANKRLKTYDWTAKKVNSLAPQTLQTLKDLKEPVKALAFVASDNPIYDPLKELFQRYAAESDKFTYDFKDPKKSVELNAKYQIKEGQTTVILSRGTGEKETHTSLSIVSEQELTNALVKLSSTGSQKIYFLSGHAEYPLESTSPATPGEQAPSLSELKSSLEQEGYTVESWDLGQHKNEIPADASMIAIAHASTPYAPGEKDAIAKYLEQGGRLLYFADFNAQSGLEPLLAQYGVEVAPGVVADGLNQQNPYEAVAFPTDHEISSVLKKLNANILMDTVRGLIPLKEGTLSGITTTPVLLSSPMSWIELTPNETPEPNENERQGAMPIVAASTRDTKTAANKRFDEARVLVFGDTDIIINANWGNEVIRNLVLNAFAWTSTQVAKITIRPPDRDISTLDLTNDLYLKIVFFSIDAFPTLLIALGIAIYVSRKSR